MAFPLGPAAASFPHLRRGGRERRQPHERGGGGRGLAVIGRARALPHAAPRPAARRRAVGSAGAVGGGDRGPVAAPALSPRPYGGTGPRGQGGSGAGP